MSRFQSWAIIAAPLLLAGCLSAGERPLPTDAVQTPDAAIKIALTDCNPANKSFFAKGWEATLGNRVWLVNWPAYHGDDPPFFHVKISAETGAIVSKCEVIVTAH